MNKEFRQKMKRAVERSEDWRRLYAEFYGKHPGITIEELMRLVLALEKDNGALIECQERLKTALYDAVLVARCEQHQTAVIPAVEFWKAKEIEWERALDGGEEGASDGGEM